MSQQGGRSAIESHTEYVRGRVRCVDCGDYVPVREQRCRNCTKGTA